MNLVESIYIVILFVVLTPGVLISLPPGSSKLVIAVTHGIVFLVIYRLTLDFVLSLSETTEGFKYSNPNPKPKLNCAQDCKKVSGSCT